VLEAVLSNTNVWTLSSNDYFCKVSNTAKDISYPVPEGIYGPLRSCSTFMAVAIIGKRSTLFFPFRAGSIFESQWITT